MGYTLSNLAAGWLATSVSTKQLLGAGVVLWSMFTISSALTLGAAAARLLPPPPVHPAPATLLPPPPSGSSNLHHSPTPRHDVDRLPAVTALALRAGARADSLPPPPPHARPPPAAPIAASTSLSILLGNRAVMGAGEGVTFPCIQSLVKNWVPADSRTRALTLIYSGGECITRSCNQGGRGRWGFRACCS